LISHKAIQNGNTFKTITNEPGFSNSISKISQDKNENIWLALDDGSLAKFNPINASFTNIKIKFPNQNSTEKPGGVESIFFDKDNNLWLGITRTGLVQVDINSGNAQQFNVVQDNDTYYSPEIKKYYNRVLNIYEDENKLFWLATPDGLYTFNRMTGRMRQISKRPAVGSNVFRNDNYRNLIRLKNKLWLVIYDSQTKEVAAKVSLDNVYGEIPGLTVKQNKKIIEKKRDFYKEDNPFD